MSNGGPDRHGALNAASPLRDVLMPRENQASRAVGECPDSRNAGNYGAGPRPVVRAHGCDGITDPITERWWQDNAVAVGRPVVVVDDHTEDGDLIDDPALGLRLSETTTSLHA